MRKPTNLIAFCRGLLVAVAMFVATAAFAQNVTVKGTVVDDAGVPVPGAGVLVAGTTTGTVTDIDGNFELAAKVGANLVISSIGYADATVTVPEGGVVNVTLHEDSEMLSEVVVTAYGQVKQSKQVGYATARVDTEQLERANVINPVNALQGKVAGVQIDAGGASGVTSSSAITIRGAKSLDKNNSPIWVIDGMIIQEPVTGALNGGDWGSQLKNLNPADYESVTVLKGAAATALYGSRGANGAIVIVSKSGKGMKRGLGIEINETLEWTNIYKSPVDLQNVYGAGTMYNISQGGLLADGSLQRTANSWGPKMDGQMLDQYLPSGQATPYVPHPDNWKALYQNGLNNTTNIAISGGNEKSSFRLSYGYMDNKGVFRRNEFDRHNISFRGNTELNDIFSIEVGIQYAFSKALNTASQGGWDWGNNAGMVTTYNMPRNYDLAEHVATYRDETGSVRSAPNTIGGTLTGYLWNRDMNTNQRSENSILADVTLRAHVTKWLDASVKANYNYYGYNHLTKGYPQNLANAGNGWTYAREGQTEGNYNFLAMLSTKEFTFAEDFTVRGNLAAEIYGNTAKNWWRKSTVGGFIVPGVFAFSNSVQNIGTNNGFNVTYTPRNMQTTSVFGIVNLGWKDQVFLELTARNDWLSSLTYPTYVLEGMNNYSVFYPSANASWVFSDTFELPEVMSLGKFRASIARVGMGTSAYATVKGYGMYSGTSIEGPNGSVSVFNPGIGTAFNPDLKPEIQQSIELGFDLRFFKDRLNFDATYYKTNTFNQILTVSSTAESGASSMLINAGNIQNQGMEFALEAIPVVTKDWHWSVGANVSFNRGKIKKLHDDVKQINFLTGYDGGPDIVAYEDGPFGVLVNPANSGYASPVWYDDEGRMVIAYDQALNDMPLFYALSLYDRNEPGDRDAHIIGKVEPDFLLSLNTSLSYKNFDLFISADGRFGGNFYSNMWKYGAPGGTFKSTLTGRDKEHGGFARIDNNGNTVYNGYMLNAVFAEGEQAPRINPDGKLGDMMDVGGMTYADAVAAGMAPTTTGAWYADNYGWGMINLPGALQDNTWFMLREITLGYRMPENLCKYVGANYLRVGLTCRNVCYLINKLTDHLNPQSISNNNPLTPVDIGAVPFYRTFAFNVTARF